MKILHAQTAAFTKRLFLLERCGKYEEAIADLTDIWADLTGLPAVEDLEPRTAAEIILRCGSLIGFHGHNKQLPDTQEKSKNLLTEARRRFLDLNEIEKVAECENYLALAYWRSGELNEADTWVEEAFSHQISFSSQTRLYTVIVKCLVLLSNKKYRDIIFLLQNIQSKIARSGDDCLRGDFYNYYGLALKNLGDPAEALAKLELARYYHQKSRHLIYLGTVENNLSQLYKSEGKFAKAHEAIDNAAKIFRYINDRTREGFSLDTKALICAAEGRYDEALKIAEAAIEILSQSENTGYLAETILTKAKVLLQLGDLTAATLSLCDAVELARTKISEAAAKNLVEEFEKARREKESPEPVEAVAEPTPLDGKLELIVPAEIAHYTDFQGVWINNSHLEQAGLRKGSLAIVAKIDINRGELAAIVEIENEAVSCGFYDAAFGIVSLECGDGEPRLFDESDVEVLGRIVGVCHPGHTPGDKMIVRPLKL